MSQEPKKRHSRARKGKRRAAIKLTVPQSSVCANCGNINLSHTVCSECGFYKGKQVLQPKTKKAEATA